MTLALEFPQCGPSILGRLDPRWRLAAIVPAAMAVALLRMPGPALTALCGALLLVVLLQVPLAWFLARLAFLALFFVLFFGWMPFLPDAQGETFALGPCTLSWRGLTLAVTMLLRALALVTLSLVLVAAGPVHETFKAAHALHAPGLIVHLALLAYRYVFLLADELGRLRVALRVRGYRNRANLHSYRTVGQVAGTLLVRGHDRAERVAQAMRCRGFDGVFRSVHEFSTTWRDVLAWCLIIGCAAGLLTWDFLIR